MPPEQKDPGMQSTGGLEATSSQNLPLRTSVASSETSHSWMETIGAVHLMNQVVWTVLANWTNITDYSTGRVFFKIRALFLVSTETIETSWASVAHYWNHSFIRTIKARVASDAFWIIVTRSECTGGTCNCLTSIRCCVSLNNWTVVVEESLRACLNELNAIN